MGGGGGISGRDRPAGGAGTGGILPGGGAAGSGVDRCADIDEFTDLLSPKPEVLTHLRRGDILSLELHKGNLPIRALRDGIVAGSVVPLLLETLFECMKRGRQFEAHVISLAGGACKVRILPK
jgi:hypothetical protein